VRAAFLANGPDVIDYLEAHTEMRFVPCGKHPDYHLNHPGAATYGRAIVPKLFDGRLLGRDFDRVRPPIPEFMILGGMMVGKDDIPRLIRRFTSPADLLYSAKLFFRLLRDRLNYTRGTRLVMGNALVARLFYSLRQRKVPILFDARINGVIRDGDAVVGAIVCHGGEELRVRARRGVVLATGGFAHNAAFRSAFMPEPTPERSLAANGNQGDGIAIGRAAGAKIAPEEHRGGAFWTPVSVTIRKDGSHGLFPHVSLDRAKPGLIAVNASGRRFVNEGVSYHDFVEAMFATHKITPTIPAYLVCDASFIRKYGIGAIYPGTTNLGSFVSNGYLAVAPTLEELGTKIGIDPVNLMETVARHNRFAVTGEDLDFGKGTSELNRFNGDSANKPNPCLGPIAIPPFCAVRVWPAEIGSSTGLSTDEHARVVDVGNRPIPGLYACGNDMASVMAGTYPGPGINLGPALVFAFRAARHAANIKPGHEPSATKPHD
jgi:succinate dehydrogenase/fumarate reductase flavoprotein subunit